MPKSQQLFEVRQHPNVRKQLATIPSRSRVRIHEKMKSLAKQPRPKSCEKLHMVDTYRLRIGDYRIIYRVDDKNFIVTIDAIGHRSQIYRHRA
jgi:mRNA interferase RelE/StbE